MCAMWDVLWVSRVAVNEYVENGIFFFRAEDGIRVAQESRGLGDVYKRQVLANLAEGLQSCLPESWSTVSLHFGDMASLGPGPVSYTHLTLPTIYSV